MTRPFLPDSDTAPPTTRRRRLLLLALVVLAAFVAGGSWFFVSLKDRQLQAVFAETDRLDPGWRLEDLDAKRPVIPDEENSALTLIAVVKKMPSRWPEWDYPLTQPELLPDPDEEDLPPPERLPSPAVGDLPPLPRVVEAGGDEVMMGGWGPGGMGDPAEEERQKFTEAMQELKPPARFTKEQAARIRAEMARAADALALARSVVKQPRGRHPVTWSKDWIGTLLPTVQDTRQVAYLLKLDAQMRAHDGDLEGALASCVAMLNASASLSDELSLICQLICIAVRAIAVGQIERVLAQGEPSVATLATLQARLEEEAEIPLNLVGMRGERAGMDRLMEAIQKGDMKLNTLNGLGSGSGNVKPFGEHLLLYVPGAVAATRAAMLRRMNDVVEIAKLPAEQQEPRLKEWEAKLKHEPLLVRELCPAIIKVSTAGWRSQAQLRCAAVALAVERYRRTHGRWPEALSDLAPAFLKAVPADPFDGQPLRYRKDKEGVVVYSVGEDRKDDGGAFDTLNTHKPDTDLGFRLWEPNRRGRPQ